MNIFSKILLGDDAEASRLGSPLWGEANLRRAQRMYEMTGGKGFRVYPKEPAVHPTFGTTRGQRKREARTVANLKEAERQMDEMKKIVAKGIQAENARAQFGCLAKGD